ncbi:MAG: ATP-binding protein [Burkholderiales bacterium]|nr:ATP-binding protein [Burkholderiales bacterium]
MNTNIGDRLSVFLDHAEDVLSRVEILLPRAPLPVDWAVTTAARWKRKGGLGVLLPVARPHTLAPERLIAIDEQKTRIDHNTRQFVEGHTANNVLLTGAPGTGKSSLVKAMLQRYAQDGLRLIEVDKTDLVDLPEILTGIESFAYRFIVFCDDLAFDAQENGYRELKAVLDGSIVAPPENVLIYATSNRRHLMPTYFHENFSGDSDHEEIRPGEGKDEKVSLAERFGLWISFYPFSEEDYLRAVMSWLHHYHVTVSDDDQETFRLTALQWARMRGAVSGRVAWQFARDYCGARGSTKS